MDFKNVFTKIDNYLRSDKGTPLIVDVQTREDLQTLLEHYNTPAHEMIHVEKYCKQDNVFKIDEFKEDLTKIVNNVFVSGLSAFLKLYGEKTIRDTLKSIVSTSVSGHVVIVTYQCKNYLRFSDPRIAESGKIIILDGEPDSTPSIVFISPKLAGAFSGCYTEFKMFPRAVEGFDGEIAYIATSVNKDSFPDSLFHITQLNNGYDILLSKDSRIQTIPQSFGSADQWNTLLEKMGNNGNLNTVVEYYFGSAYNLTSAIKDYLSFDDKQKWIYYICLSVFGVKNNNYLKYALNSIASYDELLKSIFRSIIHFDFNHSDFDGLYRERKAILSHFTGAVEEFVDYCKVVSPKGKEAIYYLTDLTQIEKEKIIHLLDKFGESFTKEELKDILTNVYPDLAKYLSTFRFRDDLLDSYFEAYKYQKVINKIIPSFEVIVDEQAHKKEFYNKLKARTTIVEKLDVTKSSAYFVDALGVEYLGFIISKCQELGLSANVRVCRAELPTLTCFNKEFVDTFKSKGCSVSDIKDLDEIKHHGKDDFDYQKVQAPVYLIEELQIIDELLKKIKTSLVTGSYDKGIVISDHGASRLAVIHETENMWSMATSGVHSGRCCPKNEIDNKPDMSIEEEGFWVLANYDRFKGSRKANVEVHGGATLEEIAVPIIEISIKQDNIEAFLMDDSRVITIGPKEIVTLKFYVGVQSSNIGIELNGKLYEAKATENDYCYSVELPDITKKGNYNCNIVIGTDVIAENQTFEIKKKGMSTIDLF